MKCPHCSTELLRLTALLNGEKKDIWIHRETVKECPYKADGVEVRVNVIDSFICTKFQELVESEGITENAIKQPIEATGEEIALKTQSDEEITKSRLAKGELSLPEFKEIKKIVQEEW